MRSVRVPTPTFFTISSAWIWITLISVQVQVECVTLSQIWTMLSQPMNTTPRPRTARTTTTSTAFRDYPVFKGVRVHRTESYHYPTTLAGDKEFEKWEQEQERKYAEEILKSLVSPNDTELQYKAKTLIANFLVNVAVDNATGASSNTPNSTLDDQNKADRFRQDYTLFFQSLGNAETESKTEYPPQKYPIDYYLPKSEFPEELPEGIQSQEISTQSPSQALSPTESVPEVISSNHEVANESNEAASTTSTETGSESSESAMSRLSALLNRFGLRPNGVVNPMNPSTEANAVSTQQANLGMQVERLRENIGRRNISGVLDESLRIASLQTVGVLVTGFLDLILCNPMDRWNGKCAQK